ncbi:hypothetical protein P3T18_003125 [Paraburkholderia sp. GAS199]|uniref:hypothetical protein n=1 Tax=Paraburkholderia sp. GAS199 TaxID=3035126 RepID=UPI003D25771E
MNSDLSNQNIVTIPLGINDVNQAFAFQIMEDCRQACEPSSYRTIADAIFVRPDLITDEPCIVIALPGVESAAVSPSTEEPQAGVWRGGNPTGKGTAYLQLRRGLVMLQTYTLRASENGSRYLVLYLFEDGVALDIIPATEALQTDMWIHEMNAQSRHPVDDDTSDDGTENAFALPIVIKRAIEVVERPATSKDDESATAADNDEGIPFLTYPTLPSQMSPSGATRPT